MSEPLSLEGELKTIVERLYRMLPVCASALDREDIFEAHALLEDVLRRQAQQIEVEGEP